MIPAPTMLFIKLEEAPKMPDCLLGLDSVAEVAEVLSPMLTQEAADEMVAPPLYGDFGDEL